MIKYGSDKIQELKFAAFHPVIEKRDEQWVDIVLRPELEAGSIVPGDLIDFTVYVICTLDGTIVQMIPQDEGCDCEYGFTAGEKGQIRAYIEQPDIQQQIASLSTNG